MFNFVLLVCKMLFLVGHFIEVTVCSAYRRFIEVCIDLEYIMHLCADVFFNCGKIISNVLQHLYDFSFGQWIHKLW